MTLDLSTLKPGDVCITHDGIEIVYVGVNTLNDKYPLIFGGKQCSYSYTKCGKIVFGGCNPGDIISLKPKVIERWVNVYRKDGTIHISSTFIIVHDAIVAGMKEGNSEYIKTIRITDEKE